jgi:hypothetical protein
MKRQASIPDATRLSLEEHHDHWERTGEREAIRDWLLSWNANLFITLAPQDRSLSAHDVREISVRWCNRVLAGCFPRNPRKRIGKFALFVEHSPGVGWHSHGVSWMPSDRIQRVTDQAGVWLAEQTAAYIHKNLVARPEVARQHSPSAQVCECDPSQDGRAVTEYSIKWWNSHAKSDRVVWAGFDSSWA